MRYMNYIELLNRISKKPIHIVTREDVERLAQSVALERVWDKLAKNDPALAKWIDGMSWQDGPEWLPTYGGLVIYFLIRKGVEITEDGVHFASQMNLEPLVEVIQNENPEIFGLLQAMLHKESFGPFSRPSWRFIDGCLIIYELLHPAN